MKKSPDPFATNWSWFVGGVLLGFIVAINVPQDKYSGSTQEQFDQLAARFMQLAVIEKKDEQLISVLLKELTNARLNSNKR